MALQDAHVVQHGPCGDEFAVELDGAGGGVEDPERHVAHLRAVAEQEPAQRGVLRVEMTEDGFGVESGHDGDFRGVCGGYGSIATEEADFAASVRVCISAFSSFTTWSANCPAALFMPSAKASAETLSTGML